MPWSQPNTLHLGNLRGPSHFGIVSSWQQQFNFSPARSIESRFAKCWTTRRLLPVADPAGGRGCRGGHGPSPSPVEVSHKKDGRQRWPHRFHVSCPPPYPAAGSDAASTFHELAWFISSYCFLVCLLLIKFTVKSSSVLFRVSPGWLLCPALWWLVLLTCYWSNCQ